VILSYSLPTARELQELTDEIPELTPNELAAAVDILGRRGKLYPDAVECLREVINNTRMPDGRYGAMRLREIFNIAF
jgi:hypothetical protein